MRTDIHRKSQLIPTNYEHVLSYNLDTQEDGWQIPSFGVNCGHNKHAENGLCCIVGMQSNPNIKWASYGSTGQCTACGAHFKYGEVWKHIPTGEHVHIGHICGKNYGLDFDRSEFDNMAEVAKRSTLQNLVRERNKKEREDFLAQYPGLEKALEIDHDVVKDIKDRFQIYRSLSDRQVQFVFKLQEEVNNTQEKKECKVEAPIGKQIFRGVIVSQKSHSNRYGTQIKITVKVETEDGIWLAWGTMPAKLDFSKGQNIYDRRGCTVELTATLSRSDNDPSFAFFKRPKGKIVEFA